MITMCQIACADEFLTPTLVAYNLPACNPRKLRWRGTEVHHHIGTHLRPWVNSQRANMVVWTKVEHRDFHRLHPHVLRM